MVVTFFCCKMKAYSSFIKWSHLASFIYSANVQWANVILFAKLKGYVTYYYYLKAMFVSQFA